MVSEGKAIFFRAVLEKYQAGRSTSPARQGPTALAGKLRCYYLSKSGYFKRASSYQTHNY